MKPMSLILYPRRRDYPSQQPRWFALKPNPATENHSARFGAPAAVLRPLPDGPVHFGGKTFDELLDEIGRSGFAELQFYPSDADWDRARRYPLSLELGLTPQPLPSGSSATPLSTSS